MLFISQASGWHKVGINARPKQHVNEVSEREEYDHSNCTLTLQWSAGKLVVWNVDHGWRRLGVG